MTKTYLTSQRQSKLSKVQEKSGSTSNDAINTSQNTDFIVKSKLKGEKRKSIGDQSEDHVDVLKSSDKTRVELVANTSNVRREKRQKTEDNNSIQTTELKLNDILNDTSNRIELVPSITNDELIQMLKSNLSKYANIKNLYELNELEEGTRSLHLSKALIDAFCDPKIIELVKLKLLENLDTLTE